MIDVSTGGSSINQVKLEYQDLFWQLNSHLAARGLENPLPYKDLWEWYGKWKRDLPSYQSRREHINELLGPVEHQIRQQSTSQTLEALPGPTGWQRVDRTVVEVRTRLAYASTEEQFQSIGLNCRELLTSLGQAVFDPAVHASADGVTVSKTDAKRMLDGYIAVTLPGRANEAARRNAKSAVDLANALQHDRSASFRKAALCVQAALSVVNLVAILAGKRDRPSIIDDGASQRIPAVTEIQA